MESEQCMNKGGKLTTISYKTQLHQTPFNFWDKGVDNSKVIVETILKKIKSYEQNSDKKWNDILKENFALGKGSQFTQANEGMLLVSHYVCLNETFLNLRFDLDG